MRSVPALNNLKTRFKEWFMRFCELNEHQAQLSLLLAGCLIVVMFGSVCAVNANSNAAALSNAASESDIGASISLESIAAGSNPGITQTTQAEKAVTAAESTVISAASKRGELAGDTVVSGLASLSDDELVEEIRSGNAGVIAREQITTNVANDSNVTHTAAVAQEPAAASETAGSETTGQAAQLNYELGIDVSKYNGDIDWSMVKAAGYSFAIIRCGGRGYGSSGGLYTDTRFAQNIQGAKAAGLKVGVYFFSQATTAYEALEEASLTLSQISGYSLDYPVVMDWETNTGYRTWTLGSADFANVITAFCSTIAQNGYTPMVYLNTSDITSRLGSYSSQILSSYKLWYALPYSNYEDGSMYQPGSATPQKGFSYSVWQYSWWGTVPGISYPVDLNVSYLGSTSLADAKINLTNTSYNTTAGTVISPLDGVSAQNSLGKSDTSGITCTITDSAGTQLTADAAALLPGVYTVTYTYQDTYKGTITATAAWTVAAAAAEATTASTSASTSASAETTSSASSAATTEVSQTTVSETSSSV